jgi:hypothetical protein
MYHLSQSRSPTLLSTFLKRRCPSRSWSQYLREKTHKKHNSYRRTMTMTTTKRMKKKKKATRMKVKMMKTTLL